METNALWVVLNQVLIAAITAATPVLVAMVVLALNQLRAKLQAQAGEHRWAQVSAIVAAAVAAAQQAGLSDELKGFVIDKKAYATAAAQKWLDEKGIKLDAADLSARIEAAVFQEIKLPLMVAGGDTPPVPDGLSARLKHAPVNN